MAHRDFTDEQIKAGRQAFYGTMTPTPPEQVETTDAAELVARLCALRVERQRIYDCGADEVDVSLTETITMLGHLIAKLSASEAEVARLQRALVNHNDQLRSACNVADRDGRETNWPTLRGSLHYTLAEHHEITNEARAALARQEPEGSSK